MAWANRVNTVSKQRVALFFCVRRILPALFFFGKVACGHSLFGRCLTITELMINEQIRDKEIRLIDENGENRGIVAIREALALAADAGLDLIEISPQAVPPVCKIFDYGKYKYEQQKKKNEARKNQKVVNIKELKLRPMIDTHDYEVKIKQARKFLTQGDKVKFTMRFKGREMSANDMGKEVLKRIVDDLEGICKVESEPKLEGRQMTMVVAPQ